MKKIFRDLFLQHHLSLYDGRFVNFFSMVRFLNRCK